MNFILIDGILINFDKIVSISKADRGLLNCCLLTAANGNTIILDIDFKTLQDKLK